MIRVIHPGSRIRMLTSTNPGSRIPDPGVKKAPDPGSQIPDPDPQHWLKGQVIISPSYLKYTEYEHEPR
jgi:hypothetical protein